VSAMRGCWSCGSHGACFEGCVCAKCLDPDGYEEWRKNDPEGYEDWLDSQQLEHGEECDCPGCTGEAGW
jgi:hypothetical protein